MDRYPLKKFLAIGLEQSFVSKWLEPLLFAAFLVANLSVILSVKVYSTLDGPAHLHNANLLNHFNSNPFLQEYFEKAPFYLPNYLSDWVLSKLLLFTDPITAEHIFLCFMVVFLPLSFRSLVKALRPEASPYTYLIFFLLPFCKLFNVGFFNFMAGFIFFNYAVVLFVRLTKEGGSWIIFALTLLNGIALYYAHALVFALAGYVILYMFITQNYKSGKRLFLMLKQLGLLYLIPLVLFVFFLINNTVQNFSGDMKPFEKVIGLMTFDAGVIYIMENEITNSALATLLLVFLFGSTATLRISESLATRNFHASDIFLWLGLGSIYLIFHSTDGMFGGMFMQRLNFLVYYFSIVWIVCHLRYFQLYFVGALIVVVVVYSSLSRERNKTLSPVSHLASEIMHAGKFLQKNSVVQVVSLHDAWFQAHFSNYLATTQPVVISQNYEASLPWFPLRWSEKVRPIMNNPLDTELNEWNYPDYVFVLGNSKRLNDEKNVGIKKFIDSRTKKIYCEKDSAFILYKVTKAINEQ